MDFQEIPLINVEIRFQHHYYTAGASLCLLLHSSILMRLHPNWLSVAMIVFLYIGTHFSDCQPQYATGEQGDLAFDCPWCRSLASCSI